MEDENKIINHINLLEETEEILRDNGYSLNNIKFIFNREGVIPVAKFVELARNINYDKNNSSIDSHIKIVGNHWWLVRKSYLNSDTKNDGWIFLKKPREPGLIASEPNLLKK